MSLTSRNCPRALIGVALTEKNHYKLTGDTDLIPGESMVVTTTGVLRLYMGDDMRRNPPKQIIVSCFNGELAYLPIERKVGVELVMEENIF